MAVWQVTTPVKVVKTPLAQLQDNTVPDKRGWYTRTVEGGEAASTSIDTHATTNVRTNLLHAHSLATYANAH